MVISILGFIIGVILGKHSNFTISTNYTVYISISILSCVQVLINGFVQVIVNDFITKAFIFEFIITIIVGLLACYVGIILNIPLYTGLIFVFCQNLCKKINTLSGFYFYNKNSTTKYYF